MSDNTITIDPTNDVTTVISVFSTTPQQQSALLTVLATNADNWLRHLDGFIAASLHPSVDGTTVVNYAQWRSPEALAAMLKDPKAQQHQAQVAELATVKPIRSHVSSIHRAPD
ncbi:MULTISPECIES: putative quinol monooxygenase [unclassified Mycolicibacterium]|uniref:putative quinol monooxygenase n=1 Tax=unclassified Mycolicibacterium TaxID=2636767 RepID=UPI002EDA5012